MPSKRENLEQLLDKNLSKTPDQARRESQSITSILQRFGGPAREIGTTIPSLDTTDELNETEAAVPIIGTPDIATPNTGTPKSGIAETDTSQNGEPELSVLTNATSNASQASISTKSERVYERPLQASSIAVDPARGWLALPNDVVDKLFPTLSLPEQAVLLRMYRLSRGYGSEVCTIGYVTLGKLCNITRNTVKGAVKSLIASGWIECLEQGTGADHSTYKINIPSATVAKSGTPKSGTPKSGRQKLGTPNDGVVINGIPTAGMVRNESKLSFPGMPAIAGIPGNGPIKEIKSSIEITHTTQGVSVGSRFSIEECRRFADHLKESGQGITNPGGYATKIYRSGEADALVAAFLNPPAQIDVSRCEECGGSGYIYIESSNPDRGVRPCKHEGLKRGGQ
jgi:hypothetical protein